MKGLSGHSDNSRVLNSILLCRLSLEWKLSSRNCYLWEMLSPFLNDQNVNALNVSMTVTVPLIRYGVTSTVYFLIFCYLSLSLSI
jgi:hypothetical protein